MQLYDSPHLIIDSEKTEPGSITWRSPSNLALVKYWGKYGIQMPQNPSLSITLDQAYTETTLSYHAFEGPESGINLNFKFEGVSNEAFGERVKRFLSGLMPVFPFLKQLQLEIETKNSFPHSAGIASSASAMSALSLCLCSLENELFNHAQSQEEFFMKASYISRLGSGSASRSVYPFAAWWGRHESLPQSSDLFAVSLETEIHDEVKTLQNAILIVSDREKSVSSSAGHELMESNIYAKERFNQAAKRCLTLLDALKKADWEEIIRITESEALTLHALMMASNPPYMLLEPGSVQIINQVQSFRKETGLPVFFSMDAGPNVHLLYPEKYNIQVEAFIEDRLLQYCGDKGVLYDKAGTGPQEIKKG